MPTGFCFIDHCSEKYNDFSEKISFVLAPQYLFVWSIESNINLSILFVCLIIIMFDTYIFYCIHSM